MPLLVNVPKVEGINNVKIEETNPLSIFKGRMTLTELTVVANNYTDENFDTEYTLEFANAAISKN